ncbi:TAP42-like family-domain-containing protein [Pterulicium gracile]|uniref:TAP42-like family-domain-containing protein n=1 Tax=Pterulicium gracile TaxID=1884261 RepID=A0A5C3QLK7_9AGAR|nr:TAP42-like family-domain-containing protein [Pterula gracilis]
MWKLDKADPKTGPLMDEAGRPLRPFTILPSGTTAADRARLKAQVFGPDHSLPTMTIDEYLEIEQERGNIITGGGYVSIFVVLPPLGFCPPSVLSSHSLLSQSCSLPPSTRTNPHPHQSRIRKRPHLLRAARARLRDGRHPRRFREGGAEEAKGGEVGSVYG